MRVAFSLLLTCILYSSAVSSIIFVPGDQPTIQAGIDAATAGVDTVVIWAGTYTWHGEGTGQDGSLLRLRTGIVVKSWSSDPGEVSIECGGSGRALFIPPDCTSEIIGCFLPATSGHDEALI